MTPYEEYERSVMGEPDRGGAFVAAVAVLVLWGLLIAGAVGSIYAVKAISAWLAS